MVVLIILLALILLIFFVPYGVDASYADDVLRMRIKAGPFRFTILPKKPLTEKQQAKKKKKQEKKAAKKAEAKKKKEEKAKAAEGKPKEETIKVKRKKEFDLEFVIALVKMGVHAIRRFFRSFSIDYLKAHYTVAGPDPYAAAMQYGYLCAAAEEIPALAGNAIRLKRSDFAFGCDFTVDKAIIDARLILSLQLYKIVHLAVAFGVEYLSYKIKSRREKKAAEALERKDENGG